MLKVDISDLKKLEAFASKLAKALSNGPYIITLDGELGAGKTTFSQYLLKALGVHSHIPSPSYTIANEYHVNNINIIHADFYRLDTEDSLDLLGWDLMTQKASIIIIEWPKTFITNPDIAIQIDNNQKRIMHINATDQLTLT